MKKLFLTLMALTSLGSLQAADQSLNDTAQFVLRSAMRGAVIASKGIEDTIDQIKNTITPTGIVVTAGALIFSATVIYIGDLMADLLTCRSIYDQRAIEARKLQRLIDERTILDSRIQTEPNNQDLQAKLRECDQDITSSRAKIAELTALVATINGD